VVAVGIVGLVVVVVDLTRLAVVFVGSHDSVLESFVAAGLGLCFVVGRSNDCPGSGGRVAPQSSPVDR